MELRGERIVLRPWRRGDEPALVRHGDNVRVWRNLTDRFPHPYRHEDAVAWIAVANPGPRPMNFAIELDGEAVGGVGCQPLDDLHQRSAEVGYWLGESHWGRGLATESFRVLVDHLWREFEFERLQAEVLAWNPASCRVLEKCGFSLESVQRRHILKDGEIMDNWLYVQLREPRGESE